MTDDLVNRLREVGGMSDDGATRWYINPDGPEAADRIEKLEAALREIASGRYSGIVLTSVPPQDPAINRAKQALEGKDD